MEERKREPKVKWVSVLPLLPAVREKTFEGQEARVLIFCSKSLDTTEQKPTEGRVGKREKRETESEGSLG